MRRDLIRLVAEICPEDEFGPVWKSARTGIFPKSRPKSGFGPFLGKPGKSEKWPKMAKNPIFHPLSKAD
jgi:hypothetical protein